MKKASVHGLAFKNDVDIDGDVLKAPISYLFKEFMKGAYSAFASRFYRAIGAEPEEADDGTHTTVNETIDVSVFERWRKDPKYRPPSFINGQSGRKSTWTHLGRLCGPMMRE